MKTIIKVLFLIMFILLPSSVTAQNAQKVYKEGVALIAKARRAKTQKARVSNCNDAIKKFKAAMSINTELAGDCQKQIGIANALMSSPSPKVHPAAKVQVPKDSLIIKEKSVLFPYDKEVKKEIDVLASSSEWTASPSSLSQNWCEVAKSGDSKKLIIRCASNAKTTFSRSVNVILTLGDCRENIEIVQEGVPVNFRVSIPPGGLLRKIQKTLNIGFNEEGQEIKLEMKKKGEAKDVIVVTNSDSIHHDKDNWKEYFKVIQKPDWCEVIPDEKVNKNNDEEEKMLVLKEKTRVLRVIAKAIPKTDKKLQNMGRDGDLILRSQNKIIKIPIYQNR